MSIFSNEKNDIAKLENLYRNGDTQDKENVRSLFFNPSDNVNMRMQDGAYITFYNVSPKLIFEEEKYKYIRITNGKAELLQKFNGRPDIIGYRHCMEISDNLKNFCSMQQEFKNMIKFLINKKSVLLKNHLVVTDSKYQEDVFSNTWAICIQSMDNHKGNTYVSNNEETIARYDEKLLIDSRRVGGSVVKQRYENMRENKEYNLNQQKKYNELFVLNNLILDMPRYNEEIIIGRKGGLGHDYLSKSISEYYKKIIGKVIPNITIISASMCTGDYIDLKIYVPANFPIHTFAYSCGVPENWNFDDFEQDSPVGARAEGSEVNLPYTTDVTGRSFTYGYRVLKVDKEDVVHLRVEYLDKPIPIDYNKLYGKEVYASMYKPEEHDQIGDRIIKVQEMLLKGTLPPLPGYTDSEIKEIDENIIDITKESIERLYKYHHEQELFDSFPEEIYDSLEKHTISEKLKNKLQSDKELMYLIKDIWKLYHDNDRIGILQSK